MPRTVATVAAVVLGTAVALPAAAADCSRARTQAALDDCVGGDSARADDVLNLLYKQVMGRLDNDGKQGLRDAQRAWLKFRDAHCAFIGSAVGGGSAEAMVVGGCLADVTNQRSMQLIYQLTCSEGDLSCVAPR